MLKSPKRAMRPESSSGSSRKKIGRFVPPLSAYVKLSTCWGSARRPTTLNTS